MKFICKLACKLIVSDTHKYFAFKCSGQYKKQSCLQETFEQIR